MKKFAIVLLPVAVLGLSACSGMNDREQRALSGGAIGAAGGALVGGLAFGAPVVGALVGAGAGAATGAVTSKEK
jgi:uncharacterized membrane protein